jgi:hypothetical protein
MLVYRIETFAEPTPGRNGDVESVFMPRAISPGIKRQRQRDEDEDDAAQQPDIVQQPPAKRQCLANEGLCIEGCSGRTKKNQACQLKKLLPQD